MSTTNEEFGCCEFDKHVDTRALESALSEIYDLFAQAQF